MDQIIERYLKTKGTSIPDHEDLAKSHNVSTISCFLLCAAPQISVALHDDPIPLALQLAGKGFW